MKKVAIAGIAVLAMFVFIGGDCGGGEPLTAPEIFKAELTETTVKLTWHASVDAELEDFKEYVVYAFTDSTLYDLAGDNDSLADYEEAFTVDTSATISGLTAGTIYYLQVRVRNMDDGVGDYSATKPYIACAPRKGAVGTQVYGQRAGVISNCGFKFSTGAVLDTAQWATMDWFLDVYSQSGTPRWVAQITPPWAHDTTKTWPRTNMKSITTTTTDVGEQIEITDADWVTPLKTGVRADSGKFYGFKCVDTTYAKVKVQKVFIDTVNLQNSYIKFDWAWQSKKGFRFLAPGQ